MDPTLAIASRALRDGDPMRALPHVALRDDAPALALRGIAMAQLGELDKARKLLERARRAFAPSDPVARARCTVAEAEVALAARELNWPAQRLDAAARRLTVEGDLVNALHARLLQAAWQLRMGRVDDAERTLASVSLRSVPFALITRAELLGVELAARRGRAAIANRALQRARTAAQRARIPALLAEVEHEARMLAEPVARLIERERERFVRLDEVEDVLASDCLIVDACRRSARGRRSTIALARRPILFALLRALAEAWPHEVTRETLVRGALGGRRVDASHRVRLRVELSRLRKEVGALCELRATPKGFVLVPRAVARVVVLAPPIEGPRASLLALLSDGERWSTSSLALALGASQRSVQRALAMLQAEGKVRAFGRGRAQRWSFATHTGFATTLLLPVPSPVP